ncbi:hypothetical protein, partial [Streptomyces phytophilus]|uniref:hypothetical protein n=1 Tax=Streptomyces phytophilus TaxID=722715 RepID=UPI001C68D774
MEDRMETRTAVSSLLTPCTDPDLPLHHICPQGPFNTSERLGTDAWQGIAILFPVVCAIHRAGVAEGNVRPHEVRPKTA